MRYFYKNDEINVRIDQADSIRILSYGRLTLAISRSSLPHAKLVASNMLNTPVAIISPGEIVPSTYSPFGFAPHEQQASVGFNGEYPDPLTGNYGLGKGYRWYSPTLKRFQAADNISPFGLGGTSAYAYTHNDPVNRYDPDGHQEIRSFRNLKAIKIQHTKDGVEGFFASQPKAGKPTLFADLHGSGEKVFYGDQAYNPEEFLKLLKRLQINTDDYKNIIFTACDSGKTFAPAIMRATHKPVKAPAGTFMSANTFNPSNNTYEISYIRKPDADFFLQPRQDPPEWYVFGLQKFEPPRTKVHDIRQSVRTGI